VGHLKLLEVKRRAEEGVHVIFQLNEISLEKIVQSSLRIKTLDFAATLFRYSGYQHEIGSA
jgi:hypothetical protein